MFSILLFALLAFGAVSSTRVNTCTPTADALTEDEVDVSVCDGPPCKLKKKNNVVVTLKIKPKNDVSSLKNSVYGILLGGALPVPFLGVDNTDACNNIFEEDGTTKASCPLKSGQSYIYKNEFKVLEVYPKVDVTVKYAIKDSKGEDLICFKLPSRIV